MKGIIYKYTFSDGKVYIGQTRRHPEKRMREHLDKTVGPTNSAFWEAYKRMGEPEYEEILQIECDNEDELVARLNAAETYYIHYYNAYLPQFGYNKRLYGTASTKTNKIIQEKYEEVFNKLLPLRLDAFFKVQHKILDTKEALTKEELFLVTEKYRKINIMQKCIDDYDLENLTNKKNKDEDKEFFLEEGLEFIQNIIISEVQEEANQYIAMNYDQIIREAKEKDAIAQIDKEGNVVRLFYSFNEICQAFNVPRADNVMNVLKGKQKTAYGFFWKYKRDV